MTETQRNTQSTEEKIEIMQAWVDGEDIQVYIIDHWVDMIATDPTWAFEHITYRIKPQEKKIHLLAFSYNGELSQIRFIDEEMDVSGLDFKAKNYVRATQFDQTVTVIV